LVCYIRKYVIILGDIDDIPVDVPPNQNIGGCVPGVVDASARVDVDLVTCTSAELGGSYLAVPTRRWV